MDYKPTGPWLFCEEEKHLTPLVKDFEKRRTFVSIMIDLN